MGEFYVSHCMKVSFIIKFIFFLTVLSCSKPQQDKFSNEKSLENVLKELNEKNPSSDATLNFSNGNLKFAACIGEAPGPYFPNIPPSYWDKFSETDDYWFIKGTSYAI